MSYFSDNEDNEDEYVSNNNSDEDDDEPRQSSKKLKTEFPDEMGGGAGSEDEEEGEDLESNVDTEDDIPTDTDTDISEYKTDNDEDEEEEIIEINNSEPAKEVGESSKKGKKTTKNRKVPIAEMESDEEDETEDNYLQKFNDGISQNYILNNHPECVVHNYHEVLSMCTVTRNADGTIIDELHRTIPYLTKYERARILGVRAKQINSGATPFVKLEEGMIDGYLIAELELKDKKIPFIIKRPMPNGGSEYWFLKDLENLIF